MVMHNVKAQKFRDVKSNATLITSQKHAFGIWLINS